MKLAFLLLFLSLNGNYSSPREIPYRQLTWDDFRAPVPTNEPFVGARSVVDMDMETRQNGDSYSFDVKAYFQPYASFVRTRTEETLRHEQTHFKIAYIASLKCNIALKPLQEGDSSAKREADRLYNQFCAERDVVNGQFDAETSHSQNKEAEKMWEQRISQQLKSIIDGRNSQNP